MEISKEEKELLKQYQSLSDSMPSLASRVAIEVVPPAIFVAIGLFTGQVIWFLVVITLMVVYNVQRVLRQYKNIIKLKSISEKTIGSIGGEPKT
ncbi:hypothetical protein L1F30_15630 [Simiduia sp. 21SJ11W-1]|uniref:hypothetical protein n=1 Tax=Simiduia sp. 21SJ11W-1 TaxID=2909669 RepID=UPI00209C9727|nr:hypothetical protein [Simiduia sp. 21SJ11W-1]UTA47572.1 hypothetical protein L1F30_15630 [Simiduia sp. 21SJ11W-1]